VPNLSTDSRTVHLLYQNVFATDTQSSIISLVNSFFFDTAFSSLSKRKACGWGGLKFLRLRLTFRSTCRPSCECRRWKPVTLERIVDTIIRSRLYIITCRYQLHTFPTENVDPHLFQTKFKDFLFLFPIINTTA